MIFVSGARWNQPGLKMGGESGSSFDLYIKRILFYMLNAYKMYENNQNMLNLCYIYA